jgi:hypothetical protein
MVEAHGLLLFGPLLFRLYGLMYLLAFQLQLLPMFGGYTAGAFPGLTLAFVSDVLQHAILPALSFILVATGGWALTMRGMMVTVQGEDFMVYAEANRMTLIDPLNQWAWAAYCDGRSFHLREQGWLEKGVAV